MEILLLAFMHPSESLQIGIFEIPYEAVTNAVL